MACKNTTAFRGIVRYQINFLYLHKLTNPALLPLSYPALSSSGFDEPDVECLKLAGLSAAPLDAPAVAVNAAKYTCHAHGGQGALREFAEHILLLKKKAKSQTEQDRINTSELTTTVKET